MNQPLAPTSAQTSVAATGDGEDGLLTRAFCWFLRALAVVFLYLSVSMWLTLVGVGDEAMRFDRVDSASRVYQAVLAVLFPVTGVGLWTTLSWGRVVWAGTIAFQTGAALLFPTHFPEAVHLVLFHGATALVVIAFSIGLPIRGKNP